jgi:hypothetical protein
MGHQVTSEVAQEVNSKITDSTGIVKRETDAIRDAITEEIIAAARHQ